MLIGGDINDLDDFETPMTRFGRGWTKGLEVHAQMLEQQLDGRMPAPIPGWALWLAALLVVAGGALDQPDRSRLAAGHHPRPPARP